MPLIAGGEEVLFSELIRVCAGWDIILRPLFSRVQLKKRSAGLSLRPWVLQVRCDVCEAPRVCSPLFSWKNRLWKMMDWLPKGPKSPSPSSHFRARWKINRSTVHIFTFKVGQNSRTHSIFDICCVSSKSNCRFHHQYEVKMCCGNKKKVSVFRSVRCSENAGRHCECRITSAK